MVTFVSWSIQVETLERMLMKWTLQGLSRAFEGWHAWAAEKSMRSRRLRQALMRMERAEVWSAFSRGTVRRRSRFTHEQRVRRRSAPGIDVFAARQA